MLFFKKLFATSIKNKPWMSYYSKLKHVLILVDASEFNDVTAQLVICVAKRRKQEEIVKVSWIMTQHIRKPPLIIKMFYFQDV